MFIRHIAAQGGPPVESTFLQIATDTANQTSYTFSSQSFGAADAGRYIVCIVTSRSGTSGRNLNSVTIGGVTATQLGNFRTDLDGDTHICAVFIAAVPAGTSGDVVIVHSNTMTSCRIALYRTLNVNPTVFDSASQAGTSGARSGSIDIPAGGVCYAAYITTSSNVITNTWGNVDEDFDSNMEGSQYSSGASKVFTTAQTNLSISCTPSNTSTTTSLIGIVSLNKI
jgi:hypothetical protein